MTKEKMYHRQPSVHPFKNKLGPLSELVSVQLRRVDILLTRGFAAAEANLTSGLIGCLGLIIGNPGISQNELAQLTGVDKSYIVTLANSLEELGWAKRTRAPDDHRRYALFATPDGEQALSRIAAQIKEVEDALLAKIPAEELRYLCDLLERMHQSCMSAIYPQPQPESIVRKARRRSSAISDAITKI